MRIADRNVSSMLSSVAAQHYHVHEVALRETGQGRHDGICEGSDSALETIPPECVGERLCRLVRYLARRRTSNLGREPS